MKVHFSHDSENVDRQRRGTHGVFQVQRCWGWLGDCQKTHKWMCPWGRGSTEHTYNVAIYSAFLCELMHLPSAPVKRRASLEPPTSCVTLSECWHCPVHEVGAELIPTSQSHFRKQAEMMNMKISERGRCACTVSLGSTPEVTSWFSEA